MNAHDLHHLAAAYALDAVDAEERRQFEAHYGTCDLCRDEVAAFRETAAVLAADVEVAPPPGLKDEIMARAAQTRQLSPLSGGPVAIESRRRTMEFGPRVLAAAAVLLIAGLGAVALLRGGSTNDDIADLVAAPDATFATLGSTEGDGQANVRVVWSEQRSEVAVVVDGLADPGPGATYELWSVGGDGGVTPAGLFKPDSSGVVRVLLPLEESVGVGWGITIEPDGGSPQPTSDVIYLGEF